MNSPQMRKILEWDAAWSRKFRLDPARGGWFRAAAFLAHSGDSWFWLAGLFILWLAARGEWHVRAALLAGGIVALAALVLLIKFRVRRQRPPGEWGAIYRNTDPHSFPSGHAARAALLVVMAAGLGPAWFAWSVAVWAPLVSLARVTTGVHYLTDVAAGLLLGAATGAVMLVLSPFLMTLFPFLF
jgi:membrane-associated phospholipid phosphatase